MAQNAMERDILEFSGAVGDPPKSATITELIIRRAILTDGAFGDLLRSLTSLRTIRLIDCNTLDLYALVRNVTGRINCLVIQNCGLADRNGPALIELLDRFNPEVIDLSGNHFTSATITHIAAYIGRVNNLKELNLNGNFVDLPSAAAVLTALGSSVCPILHIGLCPQSASVSNYHPITLQAIVPLYTRMTSRFVINLTAPAVNDYLAVSRIVPLIAKFPASQRRKVRVVVIGGKFKLLNGSWIAAAGQTSTFHHGFSPVDIEVCHGGDVQSAVNVAASVFCTKFVDIANIQRLIDGLLVEGCARGTVAKLIVVGTRPPTATFNRLVDKYRAQIEIIHCIEKPDLSAVNACLLGAVNAALERIPHMCTFWDILAANLLGARQTRIIQPFDTLSRLISRSLEGRCFVDDFSTTMPTGEFINPFTEAVGVVNAPDDFIWTLSDPVPEHNRPRFQIFNCESAPAVNGNVSLTVAHSVVVLLERIDVICVLSPSAVVIDPVNATSRLMANMLVTIPTLRKFNRQVFVDDMKATYAASYAKARASAVRRPVAVQVSVGGAVTRSAIVAPKIFDNWQVAPKIFDNWQVAPNTCGVLEVHPHVISSARRADGSHEIEPITYAAPVIGGPVVAPQRTIKPVKRKASEVDKRPKGVPVIRFPRAIERAFANWPAQKIRPIAGLQEPDHFAIEMFRLTLLGPPVFSVDENPLIKLLNIYGHIALCETALSGENPLITIPAAIVNPFVAPVDPKSRVYELTLERHAGINFAVPMLLFNRFIKSAKEKYTTAVRVYNGAILLLIEGLPLISLHRSENARGSQSTLVTLYASTPKYSPYGGASRPALEYAEPADDQTTLNYLRDCFNAIAPSYGYDMTYQFSRVK
jgi:hypothetical protein